MQILPTHRCFDDSIEYLESRVRADPKLAFGTDILLVHAIAKFPDDNPRAGQQFAHAWVEEVVKIKKVAWQTTAKTMVVARHAGLLDGQRVYMATPADEYRARLRVESVTTYTCRQVAAENKKAGDFGPWKPEYLALCAPEGTLRK